MGADSYLYNADIANQFLALGETSILETPEFSLVTPLTGALSSVGIITFRQSNNVELGDVRYFKIRARLFSVEGGPTIDDDIWVKTNLLSGAGTYNTFTDIKADTFDWNSGDFSWDETNPDGDSIQGSGGSTNDISYDENGIDNNRWEWKFIWEPIQQSLVDHFVSTSPFLSGGASNWYNIVAGGEQPLGAGSFGYFTVSLEDRRRLWVLGFNVSNI